MLSDKAPCLPISLLSEKDSSEGTILTGHRLLSQKKKLCYLHGREYSSSNNKDLRKAQYEGLCTKLVAKDRHKHVNNPTLGGKKGRGSHRSASDRTNVNANQTVRKKKTIVVRITNKIFVGTDHDPALCKKK